MIISCSNCGVNHINGTCLAEELGHKYSSALRCEYFVPIDVGSKSDKSEEGKEENKVGWSSLENVFNKIEREVEQ